MSPVLTPFSRAHRVPSAWTFDRRLAHLLRKCVFNRFTALIALVSSTTAFAETEYWISVGSYANEQNARQVLVKIKSAESVELIEVQDNESRIFRVALGPYLSEGLARARLPAIRGQFEGAWLWRRSADAIELSSRGEEGALQPTDVEINSGAIVQFGTLPRFETIEIETPYEDEMPKMVPDEARELVEEVPPNYQLHKLRRTK